MAKMKTTEKGTDLPMMNLKGKDYLPVAQRLVWFRERFPEGSIQTEITQDGEKATARATVAVPINNNYVVLATAHKIETLDSFPDGHAEKAETGAIGRALAIAGFGTQFEPEFDEGDRICDAPQETKNRSKPGHRPGPIKGTGPKEAPTPGTPNPQGASANTSRPVAATNPELRVVTAEATASAANADDEAYIKGQITAAAQEVISIKKAKTQAELKQYMKTTYGVEKKDELTLEQAKEFLAYLESLPYAAKEATQ